jgi:hypothetical protein
MSIRKALAIRKQFTVEQQQFINEKKIHGQQTASQWIDFLEEIAEFDSYVDTAKNSTQNWAWGFGIAGFLSIFSVAFLGGVAVLPVGFCFFACLLYVAINLQLNKVDIPNRMRLFVFPLLRVLKEETKPDALISIKADFKAGMSKPYFVREAKKEIHRGKVTSYFYDYPILELKTKLADGNGLQINVSDFARKNAVQKRNIRGKTKSKTKYKIKTDLQVMLTAKNENYLLKNAIQPAKTKVKQGLLYSFKENKHQFNLRKITVSTAEESIPALEEVLGLIAKGYINLLPTALGK